MKLYIALTAVLGTLTFAVPAGTQTAPAPGAARPTAVRTILASRGIASVVDAPLFFKMLRVSVPAGQTTSYMGANGFIYQLSGGLAITSEGDLTTLREGEAMFLPASKSATLKAAGSDLAIFLHFLLLRADDLSMPAEGRPSVVTELFRSREPILGLKPGPYELSLTRVTLPPKLPSNPPHHRSGAALYYVASGTGAITFGGKTESRLLGSIQYEPYDFVHQWGNPGDTPLVLLQANISPEGAPVVIFPR